MIKKMKKIALIVALVALAFNAQAKVRLPHMIGDNMVLQQQTEARLWGWAKPGQTIKITTSWSNEEQILVEPSPISEQAICATAMGCMM